MRKEEIMEGVLLREYNLRPDTEFMTMMPKMSQEQKAALEKSILEYGRPVEPITVWRGQIVDGYTRYEICVKHRLPYEIREIEMGTREEVKRWILDAHLTRRSLSILQKVRLAETFRDLYAAEAKASQGKRTDLQMDSSGRRENPEKKRESSGTPDDKKRYRPKEKRDGSEKALTHEDAARRKEARKLRRKNETTYRLAERIGTSETTYRKAKFILEHGSEDLIEQVEAGEVSIYKAYSMLKEMATESKRELDVNAMQVVKEIEKLEETLLWFLGQEYECDGEIVTDKYAGQIREFLRAAHVMTDTMGAFSMLEDNGIISVAQNTNDNGAAETDAA